ncbi:MAG: hypothetical protein CGW95_02260 [Phenylobacterium zucineum]|nr:MAG: hypothetical protein CGW95_02260 [Phenylobacterium zucineum]
MDRRIITYNSPEQEAPISLEVLVRGKGALVVLIASLGRGAEDFQDLAARLETAGYMTAAINPRGFGDSTGPAGRTMADFATDVAQVVQAFSQVSPPC